MEQLIKYLSQPWAYFIMLALGLALLQLIGLSEGREEDQAIDRAPEPIPSWLKSDPDFLKLYNYNGRDWK